MTSADARLTSIVDLLTKLVRIPSRGGTDACAPVLECIEQWFDQEGLSRRRVVSADGEPLGLYAEISGSATSDRQRYYVLNATLDTAGFGDPHAWSQPPLGARIVDGWMVGRGTADSKAGVAVFVHLLAALSRRTAEFSGRLGVLFDLDEHTGRFGGARAFFDGPAHPRPDGVLIGYPGLERIMAGARGFLRERHRLARRRGCRFRPSAQLTVTGLKAGDGGFTAVPDRCDLAVDIRLTPGFDAQAATRLVAGTAGIHDAAYPRELATDIEWIPGWPPYRVPDTHPMIRALCDAARAELGAEPPRGVAGPSNFGNYLASLSIPALCGFGVRGQQLHATDERVELATIAPVSRIYEAALLQLLRG